MLRIVFLGTPVFAVPTLSEIVAAGHEIAAVYTQPPRPAGRGLAEAKSPVHEFAASRGLDVVTPRSLEGAAEQSVFAGHGGDVAVVVAYGLILPGPVLAAPRHGCLNFHPSLLPRWRGAAPLQRSLMAGDRETAAMIMRMDEGLDTGPVCLGERVALGPDITAGELHDQMARRGADLMVRALAALERDALDCRPQPQDGACYAAKVSKSEAHIDWARPARDVHNHIRGLSPFPGAWFEAVRADKSERIKALLSRTTQGSGAPGEVLDDQATIACGEGAVRLLEVQRAGRKRAPVAEFLRGFALPVGTRLA